MGLDHWFVRWLASYRFMFLVSVPFFVLAAGGLAVAYSNDDPFRGLTLAFASMVGVTLSWAAGGALYVLTKRVEKLEEQGRKT